MAKKLIFSAFVLLMTCFQSFGVQPDTFIIRGRVTDEKGNPMTGATVIVVNTSSGTYTDQGGNYMLRVRSAGSFTLRYSFTGYESVVKQISIPETLIADATLQPHVAMIEEVIVSATRAGSTTPVAYTNINSEEIKQGNSVQDLPFLIGLTPSLVETSETGTGIGYTNLRIRGTDASRINVTIDGIPLNDAESQQVFWVDLPDLASSVNNIQVQRGVGTSANGAGAFGASVNILTENPGNEPFAEVSSTAGSFNTLKKMVSAGTGLISKKFALQMRYSDIHSDGYIKRTGTNDRAGAISGIFKTDRSFLKANIILGEEHTGISWWGVPAEMLSIDRRYNPAGEYTDASGNTKYYNNETDNYWQNHYQLIFGSSLNSYLSVHAALHYTHGKGYYEEYADNQTLSDYGLPPVNVDTFRISTSDLIRRKWLDNDFLGAVYSLTWRKGKTDFIFGGGSNIYDGDHFGRIIWMQYAGNTVNDYQWYLNKGKKNESDVYAKINYKLSDRLTAFGDIQYRYIAYRMRGPDDDLKDLTQSHFFSFLNPKAGLFLSVSPNQDTYISFSVAHREPTRADFKEASGDMEAMPRPERLYNAESGYNLRSSRADLGINLYGMFYRDQLVPTGELSNVGYPITTNVKNSYRGGIELSVSIRPAGFFNWNFNTTFSRNKILKLTEYFTNYTSDGGSQYLSKYLGTVDIAYSPSLIGSSDLIFRPYDKLGIHLISKYVGKQYFDNTMSNDRKLDPYFVSNLRIDFDQALRQVKNIELQLLVNNIFNAKYESNAYGGNWFEDGTEKTWAYYFPQAGINFMARLGVKF
ncbi:MAG: TonB-dependent receptor [Bacteroidota bacterium]|nr:TonB-dependent receptor [Bacteroidota bacterium]